MCLPEWRRIDQATLGPLGVQAACDADRCPFTNGGGDTLPVVATRCEGTTEAILHRETGMLVEPGSARQLAEALEELLTGEADYQAMSRAARERHADRFSEAAMARQVAAVYDRVLR